MNVAVRSTLAILMDEGATLRRLALWGVFALVFPVCVALQAMSPPESGIQSAKAASIDPQAIYGRVSPAIIAKAMIETSPTSIFSLNQFPAALVSARPFLFNGSMTAREQSVACLASAAWYEAGDDPVSQRSVIQVVLNRLHHPSFPKTLCGVVFQGSERSTGCQFTFTCDGSLGSRRPNPTSWLRAQQRAEAALNGAVDYSVGQATHYHADYVTPWWSKWLEPLSIVGRHIFYRWPGQRGALTVQPDNTALVSPRDLARLGFAVGVTSASLAGSSGKAIPAEMQAGASLPSPTSGLVIKPPSITQSSGADVGSGNTIVTTVNTARPSGRWALDALESCANRRGCLVVGYASAEIAARNAGLSASQRDRPIFLLRRDISSDQVLAMWDCDVSVRTDSQQCLPRDRALLNTLMRERGAI